FKPKSFNALASALPVINSSLPGIKCVHKMQMQTEDIAGIIGKLPLDKDNNTLLLEVPAQNLQLLIHLKNNKLLEKFSSVMIQHGKEQIYEGSATLTALQRFMEEQGYELNGSDSSDSAHITLYYYRDA